MSRSAFRLQSAYTEPSDAPVKANFEPQLGIAQVNFLIARDTITIWRDADADAETDRLAIPVSLGNAIINIEDETAPKIRVRVCNKVRCASSFASV